MLVVIIMHDLTRLLQSNGFEKVRTYIQSDNIVFQTSIPQPGKSIGQLIETTYDFNPEVFILGAATLKQIMENNPYATNTGNTVHVFFFDQEPHHVDHTRLRSLKAPSESYTIGKRVLYLHAPQGIGRSKLVAKMDAVFPGVTMTARNLNTINKILDMLEDTR